MHPLSSAGFTLCALSLAALAACGQTVGIGSDRDDPLSAGGACDGGTQCTDGGSGPGVDADALDGGATPKTVGDGVVACPLGLPQSGGPAPASTKTYRRSCTSKASCAVGYHYNSCCGQLLALGVETSEVPRFAPPGRICGAAPTCACASLAPEQTVAEDGDTSRFTDNHDIDVRCVEGACEAYVTSFACGADGLTCDSRTEYCQAMTPGVALPDGGVPGNTYSCQPIERSRRGAWPPDGARALAAADAHARRFPTGVLAEERAAVRVFALCDLGRVAEGARARSEFLLAHPVSPQAERVRAACAAAPRPE